MVKLKDLINESDLGLTYKKGKTVKVTNKRSGKEIVIIDKPIVRKEYEKLGFFAEETVNEEDKGESLWTWIYKGLLSGFKKAEKKGTVTLDEVARGVAFLIKTEFGAGAKRDLIKAINKHVK